MSEKIVWGKTVSGITEICTIQDNCPRHHAHFMSKRDAQYSKRNDIPFDYFESSEDFEPNRVYGYPSLDSVRIGEKEYSKEGLSSKYNSALVEDIFTRGIDDSVMPPREEHIAGRVAFLFAEDNINKVVDEIDNKKFKLFTSPEDKLTFYQNANVRLKNAIEDMEEAYMDCAFSEDLHPTSYTNFTPEQEALTEKARRYEISDKGHDALYKLKEKIGILESKVSR